MPKRDWLAEYAHRFDTVELNNSFYRLPTDTQFARWRELVPRGFQFAVKASRFLTHLKRLIDPAEPIDRLLSRAAYLGPTLGPILYQLPPGWIPDVERFEEFLRHLPTRVPGQSRPLRHVIEFRDPRGYAPSYVRLLERFHVGLCLHDMPESATPRVAVGPIVYVRLHGFAAKYGGSYPDNALSEWASWLLDAHATGRPCYVYFNNDREGFAVKNAETLRRMLGARETPTAAPP